MLIKAIYICLIPLGMILGIYTLVILVTRKDKKEKRYREQAKFDTKRASKMADLLEEKPRDYSKVPLVDWEIENIKRKKN